MDNIEVSRLGDAFQQLRVSNFTPTIHTTVYPAISPTRPELNQSGQVVLISGGGTGIGKAIAQSFVIAFASHVAIIGRRLEILETTAAELRGMAASSTQVLTYQGDMTNKSDLDSVFDDLASKGLGVDVLVLNAAKFPIPGSLMDHGMDELWEHMEANVRGPMLLTERFLKQKTEKKKVRMTTRRYRTTLTSFTVPHQRL